MRELLLAPLLSNVSNTATILRWVAILYLEYLGLKLRHFDHVVLFDQQADTHQVLDRINHQQTAGVLIGADVAVLANQWYQNFDPSAKAL